MVPFAHDARGLGFGPRRQFPIAPDEIAERCQGEHLERREFLA
jgi:hypothetical protein